MSFKRLVKPRPSKLINGKNTRYIYIFLIKKQQKFIEVTIINGEKSKKTKTVIPEEPKQYFKSVSLNELLEALRNDANNSAVVSS